MSMNRGVGPPRLKADQLMVMFLREIADRLADQTPQGKWESKEYTVGTDWMPITGGWRTATIYNDGDSDVYIRLDDLTGDKPWANSEAPLKKGENVSLPLGHRLHRLLEDPVAGMIDYGSPIIYLICQTGTASVRVFRLM